jgi:hypothetical protein
MTKELPVTTVPGNFRDAMAILDRAIPREKVVLNALADGVIVREDVMVIPKEDIIALKICIAALANVPIVLV